MATFLDSPWSSFVDKLGTSMLKVPSLGEVTTGALLSEPVGAFGPPTVPRSQPVFHTKKLDRSRAVAMCLMACVPYQDEETPRPSPPGVGSRAGACLKSSNSNATKTGRMRLKS